MNNPPELNGWLPIHMTWPSSGPQVDWGLFGSKRLLEPFFADTTATVMRRPFEVLFRHQTPMETLGDWQAKSPGIAPTGFIFHLSRCGSTLVCQMLAALKQNVVVSEAPAIDGVLRAAKLQGISEEQRILWLRGMVSALGQPRAGGEKHLFVKFDSWHAFDLPLIRQAFPEVPWIFLFRDPVEILVSQATIPALHSFPGMTKFGIPELDQARPGLVDNVTYCANVLSHVCTAALASLGDSQGRGIAVNYTQLPEAVTTCIASHFQLPLSQEDLEQTGGQGRYNAKQPQALFTSDSKEKQEKASAAIKEAAQDLTPLYDQLCLAARQASGA